MPPRRSPHLRRPAALVFYDHPEREHGALTALYDELAPTWNVGFRSIHFETASAALWALRHRPRVIVLPQCYGPSHLERILPVLAAAPSAQVLITHEEQLTIPIFHDFLWPSDPASLAVLRACGHVVWNDDSARILDGQGIGGDQIFVCGHLRSAVRDHARSPENRSRLATRWGVDPAKKWILFAENRTALLAMNDHDRREFTASGVSDSDLTQLLEEARAGVDSLMHDLAELGRLRPDLLDHVEFIYRPHPGKNVAVDLPDWAHSIGDGDIHDWLSAADVYATHQSTSIFEAALYELPCFRVGPSTPAYTIRSLADIPVAHEGIRTVFEAAGTPRDDLLRTTEVARVARDTLGDPGRVMANYVQAFTSISKRSSPARLRGRGFSVLRGVLLMPRRLSYELASWLTVRSGLIRLIGFPRSTARALSQVPYAGSWKWPGT